MSWATGYIAKIKMTGSVRFRPRGKSMTGLINSGDLVTVLSLKNNFTLSVGDIVLCKVKGRHYLHKITAVKPNQYQIGNNKGHINGWITINAIYGIVSRID